MWTMNFQMCKLDLEKAKEPAIKLSTSTVSSKKQGSFRNKHQLLLYWLCESLWLCGSQQTVENFSRYSKQYYLTCLLRNLHAGQEATVRTGHGTTDWFQIGKRVCQSCILLPCLFNLYAEYIIENARLYEAQLVSRLPEEISITSETQMTPPLWQKVNMN